MNLRIFISVLFLILLVSVLISGCNANSPNSTTPLLTHAIESAATSVVEDELNVTPTVISTVVAITSTPSPPAINVAPSEQVAVDNPRICSAIPRTFDVMSDLGVYEFSHLRFQNEDVLYFEGWSTRPEPAITEIDSSQTINVPDSGLLGRFTSARILFQTGQIDLVSKAVSHTFNELTPINNPCQEECPIDMLGESLDRGWQLIQISDWPKESLGIWLVNQEEKFHVVPYVPSTSTWQWSNDSSIFWYLHSTEEYGFDSIIINLQQPIIVNRSTQSKDDPLDGTYYQLAYSPIDHTILSTGKPSELGIDTDELLVIDANNLEVKNRLNIPGIKGVMWNDATQSFFLMIDAAEDTHFISFEGNLILEVPESTIPPLKFAISSTGNYLAVGYGAVDGIRVFKCR